MKTKKTLCVALALLMLALLLSACAKNVTLSAVYVLESAAKDGSDVTEDFSAYKAEFSEDGSLRAFISYLGLMETRNSVYVSDGITVRERYGKAEYVYRIQGEKMLTEYDDDGEKISVTLKKSTEQTEDEKAVDFESVLFGEDISNTKKFNYCPAVLTEKDGAGKETMHIWYCTNKQSGIIMDHIGYRAGVKQESGKWLFSEEKIVLEPTADTWDARHTCDPAVIKGEFALNGDRYNYLMSYLGCTSEDYQKNETGIALAKNAEGPWLKVDAVNPIVAWYDDGDEAVEQKKYQSYQGTDKIYWGTGMPALISVDGKGEVIMFYQSTLRGTGIKQIDFSDAANPIVKFTVSISSLGIVNSQGTKCSIGIPDFAYDKQTGRLYVASVTNERNPADVTLTRVNSHSMLAYIDGIADTEQLCSTLKNGSYSWKVVGYVGPSDTGWARNHNPGLVRDAYGYVPDSSQIGMVVSTGRNDWPNENIFTYRLFGKWFTL